MLTLEIDGTRYDGWESADIKRSMESIYGEFNIGLTERTGNNQPANYYVPGASVRVLYNNLQIITGYIDRPTSINASSSGKNITIGGRDKTGILMDCSPLNMRSEYTNITLGDLLDKIANPYSIAVLKNAITSTVFKSFSLQQTDTCFEIIDRACRRAGCFASVNFNGDLEVLNVGTAKSTTALTEGTNIKSLSGTFSIDGRFANYKVVSQIPCDDFENGASSYQVFGTATDPEMLKLPAPLNQRTLVIAAESALDKAGCTKRAQWEASVRVGRSSNITIVVQGWTDNSGKIWDKNILVDIIAPSIFGDKLTREYLITETAFSLDEKTGTLCTLTLKSKLAYDPQPLKVAPVAERDPFYANLREQTK